MPVCVSFYQHEPDLPNQNQTYRQGLHPFAISSRPPGTRRPANKYKSGSGAKFHNCAPQHRPWLKRRRLAGGHQTCAANNVRDHERGEARPQRSFKPPRSRPFMQAPPQEKLKSRPSPKRDQSRCGHDTAAHMLRLLSGMGICSTHPATFPQQTSQANNCRFVCRIDAHASARRINVPQPRQTFHRSISRRQKRFGAAGNARKACGSGFHNLLCATVWQPCRVLLMFRPCSCAGNICL